jgi:hypothetical protein
MQCPLEDQEPCPHGNENLFNSLDNMQSTDFWKSASPQGEKATDISPLGN